MLQSVETAMMLIKLPCHRIPSPKVFFRVAGQLRQDYLISLKIETESFTFALNKNRSYDYTL